MRRALLFLLFVTGLMGCVAPATAQPRDRAGAEALFRAGREAMDQGNYQEACQRFFESNRLDPAIGTLFNLAACKERLGLLADAWQLYQEVIDRLPDGDERIPIAKQQVQAIEPRLAHLTLELRQGAPAQAVVVKDGVELGPASLGLALPANPGEHTIMVKAAGYADKTVTFSLQEGESRSVTLDVGPALPKPEQPGPSTGLGASSAPPDVDQSGSGRTLGYVFLGVGAAGVITSLVAGALVLSKKNEVEDECEEKLCSSEGLKAGKAGKTFSTIGTISFAVGIAGLGSGTILLLTAGPASQELKSARSKVLIGVQGRF